MKVLAIDPGERVGWATANVVADVPDAAPELHPQNRGVNPLKDFAMKLGEVIADYDVVIYETFRLRANMNKAMIGNEFLPSQLIGMIRYLGWHNPSVKMVPLAPSMKQKTEKSFPRFMQEWIKNSTEEHDKDAAQLLWAWFFKEYV
ncbi:hypothetical protein [Sinimarinibacterium flocculans]|uniref:hypothetical protein n=1 Tax=Sinimarinibacterium flocculans TaxID=985250 RepID=UPI00248F4822|nr:hypothetical protein [Sinimarinibacterium flocculans]